MRPVGNSAESGDLQCRIYSEELCKELSVWRRASSVEPTPWTSQYEPVVSTLQKELQNESRSMNSTAALQRW